MTFIAAGLHQRAVTAHLADAGRRVSFVDHVSVEMIRSSAAAVVGTAAPIEILSQVEREDKDLASQLERNAAARRAELAFDLLS